MAELDLRPLSLGEVLDRTFSLYRRNFLLFLGIAAIPELLTLAFQLAQLFMQPRPGTATVVLRSPSQTALSPGMGTIMLIGFFVGLLVYLVAYLFSQGGTVYAVSELYLGRTTTIAGPSGECAAMH
jgi:hypothetical protein